MVAPVGRMQFPGRKLLWKTLFNLKRQSGVLKKMKDRLAGTKQTCSCYMPRKTEGKV
jgi:hypothetical protein